MNRSCPPRVVGLDISLNSTGIAWAHRAETARITPPKGDKGHHRLENLIRRTAEAVAGCELAVIEGPSYGSTGSTYHQLGGAWWLVVHNGVWRSGVPYIEVPPSVLKKYATGYGSGPRADKKAMVAAARAVWPAVPFTTHDEADALWLAAAGCAWLGHPVVTSPCPGALEGAKSASGAPLRGAA